MSKSTIAIVFSTDDNYAPYTSTALFSLIKNCNIKEKYDVFIFYTDLSPQKKEALYELHTENVSIYFKDLSSIIREYADLFYAPAHYSKESYYRFFIPDILGEIYEHVIYLDDDLIVNCDISEILLDIDPKMTIHDVLNYSTNSVSQRIQSLGLSYQSYINAGVLVINCKAFRKRCYFEKAIECIKHKPDLKCIDQDVLNIVCQGDIDLIAPSWNIQWHNLNDISKLVPVIQDLIVKLKHPRIIHYTSDQKPWNCKLNDYADYFFKYASENPVYSRLLK